MAYLSNTELYYSPPENFNKNIIKITDEDFKHIAKVMRHSTGDNIFVTNGLGKIYSSEIKSIDKNFIEAEIKDQISYDNKFRKITFCIPKLKNPERFEFALEKCTELGVTNFIVFDSLRTVAKGNKIERWNKILISAMKQSLRSFLPEIRLKNLEEINKENGKKIILEQNSGQKFNGFKIEENLSYFFIFGPEGGLDQKELDPFDEKNFYRLSENRLRTETAVIKCASML